MGSFAWKHIGLRKSVFYFDTEDRDYEKKLKLFINKPYKEIFNLWNNKLKERSKFIDQYICKSKIGSGKKIFKILKSIIND